MLLSFVRFMFSYRIIYRVVQNRFCGGKGVQAGALSIKTWQNIYKNDLLVGRYAESLRTFDVNSTQNIWVTTSKNCWLFDWL